ncbi:Periplasmic pH-dependent serine endoprotease DegQ precursor [Planctomycetes bacterium MalM25]|nr:Periplasmic pH-dependent serine endoprotease DegQ precursor [Planctomycetes bacterium MalM25]
MRTATSSCLVVRVLGLIGCAAVAAAQEPRGIALLQEMERAIGGVIERCERSVVSIARTPQTPEQLLGAPGAPERITPAQRLLFQNQRSLPGVLGGMQLSRDAPLQPSGAGVVIDKSGLILTQYLVVRLGETHVVTDATGGRYLAKIVAADPRSGLAVLAVERPFRAKGQAELPDFQPLPLGEAETLGKGRFVVAIGNPFSIETDGQPTASWGAITNTALKAPRDENLNDITSAIDGSYRTTLHHFGSLMQTDARLGWNASGGALVSLEGELVGVLTTAATIAGHEQPAGYAIPLNRAMRRAVETMREGLEPEYGLLGVNFDQVAFVNARTGRRGVGVKTVFTGGPAQVAGIRGGDLLLSVDDQPLRTPESLQLIVGSLPPDQTVRVAYERASKVDEAEVTLAKAYIPQGQVVSRRPTAWRGIRVDYPTAIPSGVLLQRSQDGHLDPQGCVVVSEVEEGSVSWKSGVRPYSFVSHVSGRRVHTPNEFYAAVRDAKENVKLKFTKPLPAVPAAPVIPGAAKAPK